MKNFTTTLLVLMSIIASMDGARSQEYIDSYPEQALSRMEAYYMNGIDEKLYLQLDKPYYSAGEHIWLKGYLRNAITHTPLTLSNFIYVELISKESRVISRVKIKRGSGGFNGYIALDPTLEDGDYTIRGYTRWMLNKDEEFIFSKVIKIISPLENSEEKDPKSDEREGRKREREEIDEDSSTTPDFDIQFFAEGGALLANQSQGVAFKAIGKNGLSVEVKGTIYDSKGMAIRDIETTHKGMGLVTIYTNEGESYHAMVSLNEGREYRFELPAVEQYGATIHSRIGESKLVFMACATDQSILDNAHIIIHSRGRIVSTTKALSAKASAITTDKLFDGVNVISLISDSGEVISERLIFKQPQGGAPTINIETDHENYSSRERVKVKMNLIGSSGEVASGEYGVAVTDDSSVHFDPAEENIISYLLLSSDIEGYIEEPGLYFKDQHSNLTNYNIDLLMRTQGWRRFSLERLLVGEIDTPKYQYEDVVEISGSVKGFFGNEARRPNIHVFSSSQNYFDSFELDKSSRFKLIGLDIPDSTIYVVQAKGRNGGNSLTLKIEPEVFAHPRAALSPREIEDEPYVPIAFVNQSQDQFFYEGGINQIDIDAVYVTTTTKESDNLHRFSTRSTNREQLEMMTGRSVPNIIQTLPGMMVTSDGVFYRGNNSSARFIVDGTNMEYSDITYLSADDLERIDFYSGADAAMYSDAAGGVFVLEIRQGVITGESIDSPNIARVAHLGYQRPTSLYQPKYEVKALKDSLPPDYRTTLFWDGSLSPNESGDIEFEFFTADKATSYTITIEGVTNSGEIYRATKSIMRNGS